MAVTFRRRIDNLMLRWQARLDSEWADRVLPVAFSLGLFFLLALMALAKARSLDSGSDLAAYTQGAFLLREGYEPTVTVTFNAHLLSQQASFIFYPIALLTKVLPAQPALLIVQSAALAFVVIPLWRIARRLANLRVGATVALVFVYAVYPTMHNLNLAGFHPETIALPALLGAFYFGLGRRWWLFGVCCAVVVLSRADLGLAVAGLGGLLIVEKSRRAGLATLFAGVGWTLVAGAIVQPQLGAESYAHVNAFATFGSSPLSVAWGMLTQPLTVLDRLTTEQNFNLVVVLLAPVLFLPVLAPRYLIPVLPLQILYMIADVPRDAVFGQQTVAATAFIFLATAFALARIGRMGVEKITVDRRVLGALLLASTVFFIQNAASSPYRRPWEWGGRDVVDQARLQVADQILPSSSVRASPSMLTILAERTKLYTLPPAEKPDPAAAADGVSTVVVDDREVGNWTAVERQVFRQGLESLGFTRVYDQQGIELFTRA
ncbi:MAG: DUF2079 domain-containing protein [Actinobacteria bacterium]|nr:DUF2079 domain-containing protein [Actinomycetota bacterium]